MNNKEILELIKFNKECYELTKHTEFIENNKRLYRELKFNTTFDKEKVIKIDIKPVKLSSLYFMGVKYESEEQEENYWIEREKWEKECM